MALRRLSKQKAIALLSGELGYNAVLQVYRGYQQETSYRILVIDGYTEDFSFDYAVVGYITRDLAQYLANEVFLFEEVDFKFLYSLHKVKGIRV